MARKPLAGTVAENVQQHGTGALNIDGCRIETSDSLNGGAYSENGTERDDGWGMQRGGAGEFSQPLGRWPANVIHDGSDEVVDLFPVTTSAASKQPVDAYEGESNTGFLRGRSDAGNQRADSGSAARFFYCAKASAAERGSFNNHPTVKPVALMRYLVRLVTPPSGLILDPFAGSGSTLIAAVEEGFEIVGIEENADYFAIAKKRLPSPRLF